MKTLLKSLLLSGTALASIASADAIITVTKVSQDVANIEASSSLWKEATAFSVDVFPQTTIKMNDKKANVLNQNNVSKKLEVQALNDGKNIAFKVIWKDKTQSIQDGSSSIKYADGFAVQFASNNTDATKLPYIGMGSKNRPVVVYLQKAISSSYEPNGKGDVYHQVNKGNAHAFNSKLNESLNTFDKEVQDLAVRDYQRAFVSQGFRSMTQIKDHSSKFNATMNYEENFFSANEWQGSISRSLKDEYLSISNKPFAVAFAVWDGAKMGRDGLKHLSSWVTVDMGNKKMAQSFNQESQLDLSKANIKNGEMLTQTNCASCHNYAQTNTAASVYMAPNLSNIGGYSTAAYLKESIIKPNAVVVPGYNRNAHSNFAWYYDDGQGGRMSAMPAFGHLKAQEITDMVAFLKTLKSQDKEK